MSKHDQQQQIHTTTSKQHNIIININTTAYPKIVKSKRCRRGRWRTKKLGVEGVEGEELPAFFQTGSARLDGSALSGVVSLEGGEKLNCFSSPLFGLLISAGQPVVPKLAASSQVCSSPGGGCGLAVSSPGVAVLAGLCCLKLSFAQALSSKHIAAGRHLDSLMNTILSTSIPICLNRSRKWRKSYSSMYTILSFKM